MSAESEVRAALLAHGPLVAVVPAARISIDTVDPQLPRPYIAFSKPQRTDDLSLSGAVLAVTSQIDLMCVGSNRANAIEVAELVRAALIAAQMPSDRSASGYDAENDLEVEIVTVDWFDV